MDFFKKNSYDMVRMLITQLGISVFTLVMLLPFNSIGLEQGSFGYNTAMIAISLFATGFYFVLLYMSAWDWGAKDKIRVDAGRLKKNGARLLLMSLIANTPNILFALFAVICIIFGFIFSSLGAGVFFDLIGTTSAFVIRLTSSMFHGVTAVAFGFLRSTADGADNSLFDLAQMLSFICFYVLTVLVCHFGYTLGLNDKRIFGFIKTKPKKYE